MINPLHWIFTRDIIGIFIYPRIFLHGVFSTIRNRFNRDPFFNDFRFQPHDVVDFKIEEFKVIKSLNDSKWASELENKDQKVSIQDVRATLEELRRCHVNYVGFVPRADSILILKLKDGRLIHLALSSHGRSIGHVVPRSAFSNWYYKKNEPSLDSFCTLVSHDPKQSDFEQ